MKDFAGRVVVNIHAGDNGAQEVGGEGAAPVTCATNCGLEMWEAVEPRPRPTPPVNR